MEEFIRWCGVLDFVEEGDRVALKIHFGNSHHANQIPPENLKGLVKVLKEKRCFPFLTDTNVLYRGERADTFSHMKVIYSKGFHNLGIPVIIAGGMDGEDEFSIPVRFSHFQEVYLAREYKEVQGMVALTHFKGHELAGIGGTIKNIGMGCASRKGKFAMHASIVPQIGVSECTGCGVCVKNCPGEAIVLKEGKAFIQEEKCIGCAQCIHVCPVSCIKIPWSSVSPREFQERLAEYAWGLRSLFKGRFCAFNFLTRITRDCDCVRKPGRIICPDIGVLASSDPVALDKASLDLVKKVAGRDVFLEERPAVNGVFQMDYGEKIGLGSKDYQLLEFPG